MGSGRAGQGRGLARAEGCHAGALAVGTDHRWPSRLFVYCTLLARPSMECGAVQCSAGSLSSPRGQARWFVVCRGVVRRSAFPSTRALQGSAQTPSRPRLRDSTNCRVAGDDRRTPRPTPPGRALSWPALATCVRKCLSLSRGACPAAACGLARGGAVERDLFPRRPDGPTLDMARHRQAASVRSTAAGGRRSPSASGAARRAPCGVGSWVRSPAGAMPTLHSAGALSR